jgi:hypothetical protein
MRVIFPDWDASSKVHIFCSNFCLLFGRLVPNQLKDNRSTTDCGTGASICFRRRPIVLELREKGTLQHHTGHFSLPKILRSGILWSAAERRQRHHHRPESPKDGGSDYAAISHAQVPSRSTPEEDPRIPPAPSEGLLPDNHSETAATTRHSTIPRTCRRLRLWIS